MEDDPENSLGVDCDIENVFCSDNRYLISSRDGWAWELSMDKLLLQENKRHYSSALYHEGEWRIISGGRHHPIKA